MDSTATNYNPFATSQAGMTCSYPVSPPVVPPSGGGGGGGGGGSISTTVSNGSGSAAYSTAPTVTLTTLLRMNPQPLVAYLYLSQIPYTGLDLGPIGTVLYWLVLIVLTLALAYFVLFGIAPFVNRRIRNFGARVTAVLNTQEQKIAFIQNTIPSTPSMPSIMKQELPEVPRGYSSYDGFKSFSQKEALSIEDIVKALSREHPKIVEQHNEERPAPKVEPIYESVQPTVSDMVAETGEHSSVRGFTAALIEGDRAAVFAGLRQQVRGGGSPEQLISSAVVLLDDVYRSRIDGTFCDADISRMAARISTPMLEKLIASLTIAIDSSYSSGVTGAKLALTRALSVLGA